MTQALTERYGDRIGGVLSCYDRLVITGTLPTVCYAEGMTRYLNARGIRIFDYPDFAKTLRERVRETAAALAAEAGVEIEHIGKPHIRKEDMVARVLAQRRSQTRRSAARVRCTSSATSSCSRTTSRSPGARTAGSRSPTSSAMLTPCRNEPSTTRMQTAWHGAQCRPAVGMPR